MNKLYRSRTDSKLMGLCGGLAESWHVDSNLLRLIVVGTAFFSGGTVIPLYFIASVIIPKEPVFHDLYGPNPGGPHGGPYGDPYGPQYGPHANGSYCGWKQRKHEWKNEWKNEWKQRKHEWKDELKQMKHEWKDWKKGGFGQAGSHEGNPYAGGHSSYNHPPQGGPAPDAAAKKADLDDMMKDLETKAMKKELEELRAKLAQYENKKGDQ